MQFRKNVLRLLSYVFSPFLHFFPQLSLTLIATRSLSLKQNSSTKAPNSTSKTLKEPLVSAVIPTFNRKDDLLECLRALSNSSYSNMEIVVVDNASTDGTSEAIQKLYPYVKLMKLERNTGVTGGRNAGARVAKGEFILFLDHDMIVDKQMVEELTKVIEADPSIGVAGPVIYYYDEPSKIWAAGTSISMTTGKVSFNTVNPDESGLISPFEVQVLPAAILTRKELLFQIGFFNDEFFAVYEDTDFCLRARDVGYKVLCVPDAKAWHRTPIAGEKQEIHLLGRSYYLARNRIIFMKKHAKSSSFALFLISIVPVYATYYTWRSLSHGRVKFIKEYWRGLVDGFRDVLRIS